MSKKETIRITLGQQSTSSMKEINTILRDKLEFLEGKGLFNQFKLAACTGINQGALSQWCNGKIQMSNYEKLYRIAKVLGYTISMRENKISLYTKLTK